ncbi:response regulator [Azotobacter salinestris]|uniref:response regulator n=1 Tax=Azotobacter salinestris TaxID=69964 RepID=UPI0032DEAA22
MGEQKRILHVEDDGLIQAIVRAALQTKGFEVVCASSGREALEVVSNYSPDLILLDVVMPDMDGLETLERLKGKIDIKRTPVIFMTAGANQKEMEHYRSLGARGIIIKPFNPTRLHEEIGKFL